MVGAGRFELPTYCSQSNRANQTALRPDAFYKIPRRTGLFNLTSGIFGFPEPRLQRVFGLGMRSPRKIIFGFASPILWLAQNQKQ